MSNLMCAIGRLSVNGAWPPEPKAWLEKFRGFCQVQTAKCPSCFVSTTQNKQADLPFPTCPMFERSRRGRVSLARIGTITGVALLICFVGASCNTCFVAWNQHLPSDQQVRVPSIVRGGQKHPRLRGACVIYDYYCHNK